VLGVQNDEVFLKQNKWNCHADAERSETEESNFPFSLLHLSAIRMTEPMKNSLITWNHYGNTR
jgi:hypothetical protein